jgi:ribosomal protein L11 methyltransferase
VIRLALRVRREDAEIALAELLEVAPSGVEETEVGEWVEYAVYGAPGELPELPDLRAAVGGTLVDLSTSELPDDWSERWKSFHRPTVIAAPAGVPAAGSAGVPAAGSAGVPAAGSAGVSAAGSTGVRTAGSAGVPALRVRPPWEDSAELPDTEEIVIDPGQAFGTGAHHTTRMCLELLLELSSCEPGRGPVVDVGCGSGVLAIAAARLGYAPVLGLDHEAESVRAAAENAAVNGVGEDVKVRRFDLRRDALPAVVHREAHGVSDGSMPMPGPIVLANLVRPLLLDLARSMGGARHQPAHLIASGLLREEAEEVARVFAQRMGLHLRGRRASGEWAALWLAS